MQASPAVAGDEKELITFSGEIMGLLRTQIKDGGAAAVPPRVYLWPGEGLGPPAQDQFLPRGAYTCPSACLALA